jgi:hypothetical protein
MYTEDSFAADDHCLQQERRAKRPGAEGPMWLSGAAQRRGARGACGETVYLRALMSSCAVIMSDLKRMSVLNARQMNVSVECIGSLLSTLVEIGNFFFSESFIVDPNLVHESIKILLGIRRITS